MLQKCAKLTAGRVSCKMHLQFNKCCLYINCQIIVIAHNLPPNLFPMFVNDLEECFINK